MEKITEIHGWIFAKENRIFVIFHEMDKNREYAEKFFDFEKALKRLKSILLKDKCDWMEAQLRIMEIREQYKPKSMPIKWRK